MRVVVNLDQQMVNDVQRKLGNFPRKAPNAISNAINRAVTNVNSNIKKEVRKEYNIKAKDIQSTLKKTSASRSSLRGEVRSSGELIPLEKFKVSPRSVNPRRKSPIRVAVKKGSLKKLMGAFVADVNGIKVVERKGNPRLPIKRIFGPSVPQMIKNNNIRTIIEQEGQRVFFIRLDHEINRILGSGSP